MIHMPVVIHLSLFVEDSENTEACRLYSVKNCYNGWRFLYTMPIVLAEGYARTLLIKGSLTLILSFPTAWFLLQIRRSNFRCFLHRAF